MLSAAIRAMATAETTEREVWGWREFFEEVSSLLEECGRFFDSANESYGNYIIERLETCITSLTGINYAIERAGTSGSDEVLSNYKDNIHSMIELCQLVLTKWEEMVNTIDLQPNTSLYRAQSVVPPYMRRGRPHFVISKEQLVYSSSMSFSWTDISRMLGVSRMTVYRRRVEYDLVHDPSATISDAQLKVVLREIKQENLELGEVMVLGRICAMGYKVNRERVRQEIRLMDPLHTALRWRGWQTSRRPYSVRGPNSLWHIGKSRSFERYVK